MNRIQKEFQTLEYDLQDLYEKLSGIKNISRTILYSDGNVHLSNDEEIYKYLSEKLFKSQMKDIVNGNI